jgi:GAF domain-containing protein
VSEAQTYPAADQGRRALVRLRWGLRLAVLSGLGLLELFSILALNRSAREVVLDLIVVGILSLGLIQICFNVVFRLYDRAVADRQLMANHSLRLHQLYSLSQRLMASLQERAETDGPTLKQSELPSMLRDVVEIFDAQRGSLLLLDEAGQAQRFFQVGLAVDTAPGPRPESLMREDAPVIDLDSASWVAYLMPGVERAEAFLAVPVVAGDTVWGYLALAGEVEFSAQDQSLLHGFAANVGLVLENALLFQESQQKLVEANTLSVVSQAMSSRLTQEDLLPFLADSLMRILDGAGCFIALLDPYTGELALEGAYGAYADQERVRLMQDGYVGLAHRSMESGRPVVTQAAGGRAHISASDLEGAPERPLLGLPLIVHGQVIGAVVIGESPGKRRFTETDVNRLMVVANQGAVAIANARLFREVERRVVELGTLAEISRVIFSQLQAPDIYQCVVDELSRAFGYPFVAYYRVAAGVLELGAHVGYGSGGPVAQLEWGQDLVGEAAATGQTSYVPDVGAVPDRDLAAQGVASQIALPLRKDDQVLGVLSVESFTPLTEADLSLLQSLSYQVTMAVENARLYAAEQREREVARTLLQIAGDLSGTLHLDEVLSLILERLRGVVPYESAAIGLWAGDECHLAAANDMARAKRFWGSHLVPHDLPLVSRVLNSGAPVIVADTRETDEWVPIEGGEDIRSWLGVPLVVKDRTIGLLMLNHAEVGFYDGGAARLALAFAQHAALAIDNARLYEQIQATLREQTLLHETTTAVSSTLDAGQVLQLLGDRLVMVLDVTSARIATLDEKMQFASLVAVHPNGDAGELGSVDAVEEMYELSALPITTRHLLERQPLQVTIGDAPEEWRERIQNRGGQSVLLLPLIARDRVTGFVELWESRTQRNFTEAEIALAQTLINPAAVAIDNARLFAETQRSINEMMLLYDIAVASASTLELDTVLQSVVKTLQFRVLENSVVNIWLMNDVEEVLELRAHAGGLEDIHRKKTLRESINLFGRVMRTGQPVLISDTQQELEDMQDSLAAYAQEVRSIVCVPLARGQRVVGLLEAFSVQEGAFSGHDLRLLRTMAGNLAIAIENVRLFTELKLSEEALVLRNQALEQANDRLKELDRLKSAFIASVSHELRTPLNSIIGFSEVILDGLAGELDPLAQEYLGYIHDSGRHLLDLINDILDLSRIQAGRMTLKLDQVDVIAVVEEVRATLAPMMAKKSQHFSVEQVDVVSPIVADRFRLRQVLLNLMGNACKYTQEGGHIQVRALMATPRTLEIDVVDDGPGVALEDQAMIFEEFRQARATRPGEGTGLGLAITRRLVDLHGGRIWVDSKPGMGATFTVLLPIDGPEREDNDRGPVEKGEEL